jgi:hypothetical protein
VKKDIHRNINMGKEEETSYSAAFIAAIMSAIIILISELKKRSATVSNAIRRFAYGFHE